MKRKFKIELIIEMNQKDIDSVGKSVNEIDEENIVHDIFLTYPELYKIIDIDIWDYENI